MKKLERVLSVLLLLAMLMTCMAATPNPGAQEEEEPAGTAETGSVQTASEPEAAPAEPAGGVSVTEDTAPAAAEPEARDGEPASPSAEGTEPAGEEPADRSEEPAPGPADEPQVQTDAPEDETGEPQVQTDEPEVQTDEPEVQTDEPEEETGEPEGKAGEPKAKTMTMLGSGSPIAPIANGPTGTVTVNTDGGLTYGDTKLKADLVTPTKTDDDNNEQYQEQATLTYAGNLADGVGGKGTEYTDANNFPTQAGTYTVTAKWEKKSATDDLEVTSDPFTIAPKKIKITVTDSEEYNGQEQSLNLINKKNVIEGTVNSSLANSDKLVSLSGTVKGTNAGEYTTAVEGSPFTAEIKDSSEAKDVTFNYDITYDVKLTITPKTGTVTLDNQAELDSLNFVYDGTEQKWAPELKVDSTTILEAGTDYTLKYEPESPINAGKVTVTATLVNYTDKSNFPNGSKSWTYQINKKAVTLAPAADQSKLFGQKDPELQPVVAEGIVEADKATVDLSAVAQTREAGEAPGDYKITIDPTSIEQLNTEYDNYEFKAAEETAAVTFKIDAKAAFKAVLGDEEAEDDVTARTAEVGYQLVAENDPATGAPYELLDDLAAQVSVTLKVTPPESGSYVVQPPKPEDPDAPVIPAVPPVLEPAKAAEGETAAPNKFDLPVISYARTVDGRSEPLTWSSYLPAGTELELLVVPVTVEGAAAPALTFNTNTKTVIPVSAALNLAVSAGAGMTVYDDAQGKITDENGRVSVSQAAAEGEQAGALADSDWVILTVNGGRWYVQWKDIASAFPAGGAITLPALQTVLGAGSWAGTNPAGKLSISVEPADNVNFDAAAATVSVAFDTGAENTTQQVGNREQAESIALPIADSVSGTATVEGVYGANAPTVDVSAGPNGTMTWSDPTAWMQTPETLPASGSQFVVRYTDLVGHPVTHTVSVTKSEAVSGTTIYVKPISGGTVPSGNLNFYGVGNVWEKMTLTVGNATFTIDPLAGGAVYDNSTKQWSAVVNLGNINFPVGQPTNASIDYDDLVGGAASIVLTYKDEAQTPAMGCEAVVGGNALWGFVESSSSVYVDIYHADGTSTAVPASNVAVDQFGYFYARLDATLAEGDVVYITTVDFCGNTKRVMVPATTALAPSAHAEMLGANIVGETEYGTTEHRFATPIDLSALTVGTPVQLPILAYKGIEIGRVNILLNEQGSLEMSYSIKAVDYLPDGAQARCSTYSTRPEIDQLVSATHAVAVQDLKAAPDGRLVTIDVSAARAQDGTYSGVIWVYAEFDVEMDVANYVNRGGRGVSFYRWLDESLQTESLLNTVYSEIASYQDNVDFYKQYQRFEDISRRYDG